MNEITVVVKQDPGRVTWNFEEVKGFLAAEMDKYSGLVYTDETIGTAKSDVAYLRSLVKQIEERRKEVKARCLEPYETIEKQAKELVSLINQPIDAINKRVQEYEIRRKDQIKAEISACWRKEVSRIPEKLRAKAWDKIYDQRWLNVTFSKKIWRSAIETGISGIENDLNAIRGFNSEFQSEMEEAFSWQLSLSDAVNRMNALNEQKQKILEREQRRLEEETRKKLEAEEAARKAEEAATVPETKNSTPEVEKRPIEAINASKSQESVQKPEENVQKPQESDNKLQDAAYMTLRIYGAPAVLDKIKKYITFTGSRYEEVDE